MAKISFNIDGKEVQGFPGQTILDVAKENGIDIPTLCYDPRTKIFGSCGLCVVEMEGFPKLLRSCATEISEGSVIKTKTERVLESRKTNLELLLTQHSGDCRPPCALACPAQTDCQGYVGLIANGKTEEALELIKEKIPLPASIGRVCPHPCEDACRRKLVEDPVSILNLKRYAADLDLGKANPYLPEVAPCTGMSVAIIGGGPGGLSAAYYLRQMGHCVTVIDAQPKLGGMLRYGIPEYRLPKEVLQAEIDLIEKIGVKYQLNTKIGKDISFESLQSQYDAIIIAVGAWTSASLRCPGEDLDGVFGGIHFLRKYVANEELVVGKKVAVVGGGNTAMDACRTAIRLGAEKVYNIYRRTKNEMPAEEIEIKEAEEEGVDFRYLVNPIEVIGKGGKVKQIRLQIMELGEPDASGRRRPVPVEGKEEILDVDTVIAAIGQGVDPANMGEVELTKWNTIAADEKLFTTNVEGVFAIGDCVNKGASIAIEAIGNAKAAAAAVNDYLSGKEMNFGSDYLVKRDDLTESDFSNRKKEPRSLMFHLSPEERKDNFLEVLPEGFDEERAKKDASRCLECGCHDYFECKLIKMAKEADVVPSRLTDDVKRIEFEDPHPFIVRDPNKCVLCGLCVRVCDEVVGSTALGFVERGINTVIAPAFNQPLAETSCVSCGQCISVCPTGALQERSVVNKPIPLDVKVTDSVCNFCSVGCSVRHESYGDMYVKTVPAAPEVGVNGGLMCGVGRFGVNYVNAGERITEPLMKKDGKFVPVSWHDAYIYAAKQLESLRVRGQKTALAVGQHFNIKDAAAIMSLADLLEADAFSYQYKANAIADALGVNASPNAIAELAGTEMIIVVGDTAVDNAVLNAKLREAKAKGARIIYIDECNKACRVDAEYYAAGENNALLRGIVKALLANAPADLPGSKELTKALAKIKVSAEAEAIAAAYAGAKRAMILFSQAELSYEAAADIANMAILSGHIGSPRNGIVMIQKAAGTQVLADLGLSQGAEAAKGAKGLIIFGEDVPNANFRSVDYVIVADTHMTKTAAKADLVIPLAGFTENCGAFANTERRIQKAAAPLAKKAPSAAEICNNIAAVFEQEIGDADYCCIYQGAELGDTYCFGCELDKNLISSADAALKDRVPEVNHVVRTIKEALPK